MILKDPCVKCSGMVVFEDTLFEGKEMKCVNCGSYQIPSRTDPDNESQYFGDTRYGKKRTHVQEGNYSYKNYLKGLLCDTME